MDLYPACDPFSLAPVPCSMGRGFAPPSTVTFHDVY